MKRTMKKGYTLIELMVSLGIIIICTGLIVFTFMAIVGDPSTQVDASEIVIDNNVNVKIIEFRPYSITEIRATEATISKYVDKGWKITHTSAIDTRCVIILQKKGFD